MTAAAGSANDVSALHAEIVRLRAIADRAAALQTVLAEVGRALTVREVADIVAARARELLGSAAALLFLRDEGSDTLELVSFGGAPPARVSPWARLPLDAPHPICRSVREGLPVWVASRAQLVEEWPGLANVALDGVPLQGIVTLPVGDGRTILGGLGLSYYREPDLGHDRREHFEAFATQCGLAIQRARSYDAERRAREAEERTNAELERQRGQLEVLAEVTRLLSTSLNPRQAMEALARAVVPSLADWCAVDVREDDGTVRRLALWHHDAERLAWARSIEDELESLRDPGHGVDKVLATGETEWVPEIDDAMLQAGARSPEHLALLRRLAMSSVAVVPLTMRDRVIGALTLVTEGENRIRPPDLRFAEVLANRAAIALDNAQLYQAAENARSHLHGLFEVLPAGVAVLRGRALRCELLNAAGAEVLGRRDALGRPLREVLPELEGTGVFERLEQVFDSGEAWSGREVSVRPAGREGAERWFDLVCQPLRDDGGAVDGVVVFSFEISQGVLARQRVEALAAQVAHSEARMRALVDATATLVWTATPDGRVGELSPSWLAFTGQASADYLDGGSVNAIHPEDREATLRVWRAAVAAGEQYSGEYRVRRADGAWVSTLARASPVRDANGVVLEYVGCNIDITELRAAESRARDHARIVTRLNQLSHVIAAELDPQVVVQSITDAATELTHAQFGAFFYNVVDDQGARYTLYTISGVPAERFSGFPMPRPTEVFAPTFHGEGVVRSADITRDPRYGRSPPHHGMPPGHLPVRSYLAVPVVSRTTEVIGGIFLGHEEADVFDEEAESIAVRLAEKASLALDNARLHSDARRLIAQLEATNRELDQFAYVASHDLKAPLRAIGRLAEWLEEDLGVIPDEARNRLVMLRRRVQRMEALIQGILEFSRVGRTPARREDVAVGRLVGELWDLLAPPAPARLQVADDLPVVHTERAALQQVFLNLMANAVKHARKPDVEVRVDAVDTGDQWQFCVADDGAGIAPAFHERIWGIFQTLDSRDASENTGIGLAVVRKVVESRGGRAWVESEEGHGARFCFTWPKRSALSPYPTIEAS